MSQDDTRAPRDDLRWCLLPGVASLVHALWCLCNGAGVAEVSGLLSAFYLVAAGLQAVGGVALLAGRAWGARLASVGQASFGLFLVGLGIFQLVTSLERGAAALELGLGGVALALAGWLWRAHAVLRQPKAPAANAAA